MATFLYLLVEHILPKQLLAGLPPAGIAPFLSANVTGRDGTRQINPTVRRSRAPAHRTHTRTRTTVYSRVHAAMRPGAILLAAVTGPRARVYSSSNFRRESVHELNTRRLLPSVTEERREHQDAGTPEHQNAKDKPCFGKR